MVLVLVLGGWLGWIVHRARVQREVVAAVEREGGQVGYESDGDVYFLPKRRIWAPRWLVDSLGIDYFSSVDHVGFDKPGADEIAGLLARLPRLDGADFDDSDLSDSGLARLQGLDLHYLCLLQTKVTDAGVRHIRSLTNLEDLYLSHTSVGDAGMADLATLPKLSVLHVNETNVTDLGINSIVKLPALKFLDLSGTRMGDDGAALLASKVRLQVINLEGTRVSPSAIRALRAALPNADISAP
jgi:Leucine Rich repeat